MESLRQTYVYGSPSYPKKITLALGGFLGVLLIPRLLIPPLTVLLIPLLFLVILFGVTLTTWSQNIRGKI